MDKQKAAEVFWEKHFGESPTTKPNAFIAGWEACEAQSPIDAVKLQFAEWTSKNDWVFQEATSLWYNKEHEFNEQTTAELYRLFNPSGVAPQKTICQHEPFSKDSTICGLCGSPMPQAAGPIWVKLSEGLPEVGTISPIKYRNEGRMKVISARYIGEVSCTPKWIEDKDSRPNEFYALEWLDESGQQAFTREQLEDALFFGMGAGLLHNDPDKAVPICREYMNTNYPLK